MVRGRKLAAILAGILLSGVLAAWSGLFPIGASSGHWAVTEWFLQFTMRRTVEVRSSRISVPPLGDAAMVARGAAYYEFGCRFCHGSPGETRPVPLRHMTPPAPELSSNLLEWRPEELFWIVKHGIKFTGMPGWPSLNREDEVWDMVAFLRELPEMGPADYRELAGLDRKAPPEAPPALATCARCHEIDGQGRGGAFPRLAGQSSTYLYCSLTAFAERRRFSGVMETIASTLSDREMSQLALYYGRLSPRPSTAGGDPDAVRRGEEIALRGVPRERVPSCSDCHGPARNPSRRPNFPRLAGQSPSYLRLQLELFRSGRRGGSPFAHLMHPVARGLTKEQMEDVALFYGSLMEEPGAPPDPFREVCGVMTQTPLGER